MVEERLSLPKVIPKELKEKRRVSLNREESNKNLTKGLFPSFQAMFAAI